MTARLLRSHSSAWGPPLLLVAAGALAYHETLGVPFLFDDHRWIVDNPAIRSLADPSAILTGTNRPVLQLSFALDFALGGLSPGGYHLVNIAIHVLAGLTLFGVVRRTLCAPRLAGARAEGSGGATGTALVIALLWLLHPLQTQAVTYTVQRGESLVSLFYLLTLYCGIRGARGVCAGEALRETPAYAWTAAGLVACALGMGTKPVMVSAPIVVLLYDRSFLTGSLREALRQRPVWYAGLFASWGVLALAVQDVSGGLGEDPPSTLAYALTQPGVLLHYLRLVFWPHPLCFDYSWPLATTASQIGPPALVIGSLVGLSAWGLWRGYAWGFLAAACWLVLAPTSTLLPLADPAFEHRMYLALAPLLVLVVLTVRRALARVDPSGRAAPVLVIVVALALGVATLQRNRVYLSPITLWQDVLTVAPDNARAHHNLGLRLLEAGRSDEAEPHLRAAQRLAPQWADPMASLGYLIAKRGELERAREWYERSVAADPRVASARIAYGSLLAQLERPADAVKHYRAAIALEPERGDIRVFLGLVLDRLGESDQALLALAEARRLGVESADADLVHAAILLRIGRDEEAFSLLREGLRREPDSIALANNLAWQLATHSDRALRDPAEAVRLAERAAAGSERRDAEVLDTLAAALAAAGRSAEARATIDEAYVLALSRRDDALARRLMERRAKLDGEDASPGVSGP